MSVINKMLRDLDRRQGRTPGTSTVLDASGGGGSGAEASAVAGTPGGVAMPLAGVPVWGLASTRRRSTLWAVLGLFFALALGAGWWLQRSGDLPGLTVKVAVTTTQTTPGPSVAAPMAASSQAVPSAVAESAGASASGTVVPGITLPDSVQTAPSSVLPNAAPLAESSGAPIAIAPPAAAPATSSAQSPVPERVWAQTGLKMETTLAVRKAVESNNSKTGPVAALAPQPLPESRPPASQEALLRAQSLWNAGSREAAMDWLQEAITVAERSPVTANTAAGNPLLLPLVREQARMLLAEGRYSALWELLSRLEPQLGTAPDLWAIRANAAQRLGRHQDSVHAYMMALQARPDEQRWMLGAAVSLAALGQITSAAEMAERARAMGVVSKDVLAYLRQMGVPLK